MCIASGPGPPPFIPRPDLATARSPSEQSGIFYARASCLRTISSSTCILVTTFSSWKKESWKLYINASAYNILLRTSVCAISLAMKIKHENLTSEILYRRKYPDLQYNDNYIVACSGQSLE